MSGDLIAISGSCTNTVEVYRRVDGVWRHEATLTRPAWAPNPEYYFYFGDSVDVQGDHIVVGDSAAGDNLNGAVFVYSYRNRQWVEGARLQAYDGAIGNGFGFAVSLCDDQLAVGAPGTSEHGWHSGSVYLYRWVAVSEDVDRSVTPKPTGAWLFTQKLTSFNTYTAAQFGSELGLTGSVLVAGRSANPFNTEDPWAFMYTRAGPTWVNKTVLSERGDSFPKSVSVDGNFAHSKPKFTLSASYIRYVTLRCYRPAFQG